MKKNSFRVALFDLDGTLIDTEGQYTQFWGAIAREFRPDVERLEYLIKGTTLRQIYDRYFPDPAMQSEITRRLDRFEQEMRYEFLPGALDFLADIRQHGVRCAVVTSSNQPKMQSVRAQVPQFDSLFDRVLTSEDFAASKPDPCCYLLGARVFDADIHQCVVFEDALTGLEAGMRSGIFTIGLATGNPRSVIAPLCHHVEDDFTHLSYERILEIVNL